MQYQIYIFFLTLIFSCSKFVVQNQKEQLVFDSELSAFEYPFEVYSFSFQSQEKKLVMRYGDLGSKSNSKVAVLLHGKNFSGHYWDRIAKDLVEKGYRVIIPDQIGFGKSSKPTNYQYSFAQLGINTIKLLDHLGVKDFSLVGHSMGGMLAVHMTSMTRRVQKLYLINPIGLEDYLRYVEFKDPSFFYEIELKKTVEDFRNYQKKNYYDGQWNDKYEELLTPFKGWVSGPNKELVDWNNALTYGPIFSEEIVSKFANLKVPTYLVLGTRDRAAPGRLWKKPGVKRKLGQYQKLGKEIQGLNPKIIKIFELTGLGHMPHFEDYERFSKVFFPLFNSGTL